MTQKHFEAFANYIADLRQVAADHSNMEGESEEVLFASRECEAMVVEVASKFSDLFNEEKFRKACQPKS